MVSGIADFLNPAGCVSTNSFFLRNLRAVGTSDTHYLARYVEPDIDHFTNGRIAATEIDLFLKKLDYLSVSVTSHPIVSMGRKFDSHGLLAVNDNRRYHCKQNDNDDYRPIIIQPKIKQRLAEILLLRHDAFCLLP